MAIRLASTAGSVSQVVDRPADAPRPGADGAPFVGSGSRLPFLERQSDHAFLPSVGAVRLDLAVGQRGIAPAAVEYLSHGIESAGDAPVRGADFVDSAFPGDGRRPLLSWRRLDGAVRAETEGDAQKHRHRPARLGREIHGQIHPRAVRLDTHPAGHALHDRRAAAGAGIRLRHLPGHLGHVRRHAAVDLIPVAA